MQQIGVRELRQNASRYLARVKAGETVEVTERGRLIALLVPPEPSASARDRLIADGRLIGGAGHLTLPDPVASPVSSEELLADLRADR